MARNTGNKPADRLTQIVTDARRMGYSDEQAQAMAREEADQYGTYDLAVAADTTARALRR